MLLMAYMSLKVGFISGAYLLVMSSLGGKREAMGNKTSSFSSVADEYLDNYYIMRKWFEIIFSMRSQD
jgi:hypothetical protein